MNTMERFQEYAVQKIGECEAVLTKFGSKLDEAPAHTFSWADSAVRAAAELELYKKVLFLSKEGMSFKGIHESLAREAISLARNPARSTSPMHNLVEQERLAARGQLLDSWAFNGFLEAEAKEVTA